MQREPKKSVKEKTDNLNKPKTTKNRKLGESDDESDLDDDYYGEQNYGDEDGALIGDRKAVNQ